MSELELLPIVGEWYKNESGEKFEVVAFDQDGDAVEIQYYDGAIAELDLESWNASGIHTTEPPEDWKGSYDVPSEDYGLNADSSGSYDRRDPLEDYKK